MKYALILICLALGFNACKNDNEKVPNPHIDNQEIINQFVANYEQLPEEEIIKSPDNRVFAQYAMPTEKYGHGILGDKIEAEQLVVAVDGVFYDVKLSDNYVFEDISPRLVDVDGDSELEFITIRTSVFLGAGMVIYKIEGEQLIEYAHVTEIGTSYRWLNIVAINDLDNDGIVELAWIQTPHIGGVLKVAKIKPGTLEVIDEREQYSNHAIGERNLCLSVLTEQLNQKVFYVPNQSRNNISGFSFNNNQLEIFGNISQDVDFSMNLASQYDFENIISTGNNCDLTK